VHTPCPHVPLSYMENLVDYSCCSRGCQFASTATRRLRNHILFRQRDKQVALKPAEGYISFRPRLSAYRSIKTTIPSFQVCATESYLVNLNDVSLFAPLSTSTFGQSCSITTFPPDHYTYLTRSQFVPVIFRVLRAIGRRVRGSARPSLFTHCVVDVLMSPHFMSRSRPQRDHCCLLGLIFN